MLQRSWLATTLLLACSPGAADSKGTDDWSQDSAQATTSPVDVTTTTPSSTLGDGGSTPSSTTTTTGSDSTSGVATSGIISTTTDTTTTNTTTVETTTAETTTIAETTTSESGTTGEQAGNDLIIFVTKDVFPADINLNDIQEAVATGADKACQAAAAAGKLSGNYKAWLSTSTVDAKMSLPAGKKWRLPDGTEVGITGELLNGSLVQAINRDEDGVPAIGQAWTGTEGDGTASNFTCANWTTKSENLSGTLGSTSQTDYRWTRDGNPLTCDKLHHLYCFLTP